jgi:hypothetical protein
VQRDEEEIDRGTGDGEEIVSFQTDFSASSSCKLVRALCKASIVLEMEG